MNSGKVQKQNISILQAKSGKEGIKLAIEHMPDAITLDVMMPEMDGIETCMQIREDNDLKNTLTNLQGENCYNNIHKCKFNTSSNKSVPPSAALMIPTFAVDAPVNDPFSCPNNIASNMFSGIAAQLIATN